MKLPIIDYKNISSYLFLLIAFFIPVWLKVAVPLLLIMVFFWIIEGKWKSSLYFIKKNKYAQLMILFWLLHLIGVLYSNNWKYGLQDVQQKLSLLIFPLVVLGFSNIENLSRDKVLRFFLLGSIVSGFVCLLNATIHTIHFESGSIVFNAIPSDYDYENYFKYERLAFLHHPTYLSMYFTFAIAVVFRFYKDVVDSLFRKLFYGLTVVFFAALIYLLNSRIGLIAGFLTIIIGMIWLNKRNLYRILIGSTIVISIISLFFIFSFDSFNDALAEVKYSAGYIFNRGAVGEGDGDMRLKIWSCIPNVMKQHYLFGHGTGDFHIVLNKEYVAQNLNDAAEKNLNAHNQFIETLISLGFVGLITLVDLIFYPLVFKLKERDDLFIINSFLLIIVLNFMTESILSRIGGVIFFAFFYSVFFIYKEELE